MAAAFTALRGLLGLFFLLTGTVKLSARPSARLHRHVSQGFAEVFPRSALGSCPGRYLVPMSWVGAVAGLLLACGPQLLQDICDLTLSLLVIGAISTLWEPLAMCAPATLCLGLLLLSIHRHVDPPK
ncbi:TM35B protein, partial [Podargus strigoides]|nr:TM35B protein [Podargus strigoides]